MNKRSIHKIIAGSVIAYISFYVAIRLKTNTIVHVSGVSDCDYATHDVVPGDSILTGYVINSGLALFFTPLRLLELGYWNVVQQVDSPISEKDKKLKKFASCTST
ncbi:MAG: hypothetical protein AAFW70_11950 [Cyanobacteria bacterium J06635_10]